MFGPDTALVFDAIQMVALAAAFTGTAVFVIMRRKQAGAAAKPSDATAHAKDDLENRVRVLERSATDPATRLADEFERLERGENTGKEHA